MGVAVGVLVGRCVLVGCRVFILVDSGVSVGIGRAVGDGVLVVSGRRVGLVVAVDGGRADAVSAIAV